MTCLIKSVADGFEAKWVGEIYSKFIQFKIEKPDFEDVEGVYTFVQNENT